MDIEFKIKGKANQYYICEIPSKTELEEEIEQVLFEELDIIASIEVTDYQQM